MLVLDEPTNYLDRESLGALAAGIADYGGAVVMISHNSGGWGGWMCCCPWACLGWVDVLPPQRVLRLLPQSRGWGDGCRVGPMRCCLWACWGAAVQPTCRQPSGVCGQSMHPWVGS